MPSWQSAGSHLLWLVERCEIAVDDLEAQNIQGPIILEFFLELNQSIYSWKMKLIVRGLPLSKVKYAFAARPSKVMTYKHHS